jgi:hypothetical protein
VGLVGRKDELEQVSHRGESGGKVLLTAMTLAINRGLMKERMIMTMAIMIYGMMGLLAEQTRLVGDLPVLVAVIGIILAPSLELFVHE